MVTSESLFAMGVSGVLVDAVPVSPVGVVIDAVSESLSEVGAAGAGATGFCPVACKSPFSWNSVIHVEPTQRSCVFRCVKFPVVAFSTAVVMDCANPLISFERYCIATMSGAMSPS